jgi:beta-1,4-mannosyl-glycoprotein beta-1,4-N-acetylglucosaminyltransferase
MKKIIDCFTYFNEVELLELRYHLLKDSVDYFVIADANRTHTGEPKPFTLKETIKKLGLSLEKIKVLEVSLPSKEEEPDDNVRGAIQKNAMAEYISWNTVAFVGDADEILNPKYIKYYETIVRNNPNSILRVPMSFLVGRADLVDCDETGKSRLWANCYMCMGHHKEKYSLDEIRMSYQNNTRHIVYKDIFAIDNGIIEDAGWHFTWMGGSDRIKTKFKSFQHFNHNIQDTEFGQDQDKMLEYMDQWKPAPGQLDPLGRRTHILKPYPVEELPQVIFDLPSVKKFLLPDYE